jgi:hypothetical protein
MLVTLTVRRVTQHSEAADNYGCSLTFGPSCMHTVRGWPSRAEGDEHGKPVCTFQQQLLCQRRAPSRRAAVADVSASPGL